MRDIDKFLVPVSIIWDVLLPNMFKSEFVSVWNVRKLVFMYHCCSTTHSYIEIVSPLFNYIEIP